MEQRDTGVIYAISDTANSLMYIGQTITSIKTRFNQHRQSAVNGETSKLYNAMREIGEDKFRIAPVVTGIPTSMLDIIETLIIYGLGCDLEGLNTTIGCGTLRFTAQGGVVVDVKTTEHLNDFEIAKQCLLSQTPHILECAIERFFNESGIEMPKDISLEDSLTSAIVVDSRQTIRTYTKSALKAKAELLSMARDAYSQGDMETANKWIAVAEAKSRVKRGLAWWVERNFKLGGLHEQSAEEVAHRNKAISQGADMDEANKRAAQAIRQYLADGGKRSYMGIARWLNENNYKTRRGADGWRHQGVKNLMERFNL